jgi:hypothetical protein
MLIRSKTFITFEIVFLNLDDVNGFIDEDMSDKELQHRRHVHHLLVIRHDNDAASSALVSKRNQQQRLLQFVTNNIVRRLGGSEWVWRIYLSARTAVTLHIFDFHFLFILIFRCPLRCARFIACCLLLLLPYLRSLDAPLCLVSGRRNNDRPPPPVAALRVLIFLCIVLYR